jgi:hypothetical protein
MSTTFDLDDFEREQESPPFAVRVGNRDFTLLAPGDIAWGVSQSVQRTSEWLAAIAGDRADDFLDVLDRQPAFKVDALADAYVKHFTP